MLLPPVIEIETFSDLLPYLRGRVFHITLISTLVEIREIGALKQNFGNRVSPFGNTSNGYFRSKGCVSFFDYRNCESAEWEEHAYKCLPTLPLQKEGSIVVLFLSESEHYKLQSWENWKFEQLWSFRVVPYVECGYPAPFSFADIERTLHVQLKTNPAN